MHVTPTCQPVYNVTHTVSKKSCGFITKRNYIFVDVASVMSICSLFFYADCPIRHTHSWTFAGGCGSNLSPGQTVHESQLAILLDETEYDMKNYAD